MRIAFRADASTTIGLGHVSRCLSLAHALRHAGANVVLLNRELGADLRALPLTEGFDVAYLPAPRPATSWQPSAGEPAHAALAGVPWQIDAEQTADALVRLQIDWLVVDHYALDSRWHTAVRNRLGCRMACIDDLGDRDLAVDLLIDHNVATDHRAKYGAHIADDTPILGGPHYALLGPAFARAAPYVYRDRVSTIGVFMGGTDQSNFTEVALRACREVIGFRGPIEVVTTTANPNLANLRLVCGTWPDTDLLLGLPDLASFFSRHDLQLGAGGGATWERCSVGAPSLALVCAPNQEQVLLPLEALGVVRIARLAQPLRPEQLADDIAVLLNNASMRESMATNGRLLVDGQGASRVSQTIMSSCGK